MAIFKPYCGAGVLFTAGTEVLLAKRRFSPFAGNFSVFGGKQEFVDRGSLFETALREAAEETCNGVKLERFLKNYLAVPLDESRLQQDAIDWPFFRWVTYIVPLRRKPDLKSWPKLNLEFNSADWFSVGNLPEPLHPFVGKLVKRIGANAA